MESKLNRARTSNFRTRSGNSIPVEGFELDIQGIMVKRYTGEYWPSRQRGGNSIHEISYRACYKSELPAFFIREFGKKGTRIFDPFSGRGTTIIEGVLHGISGTGMDSNPLSEILSVPRWNIPEIEEITSRLSGIFSKRENLEAEMDLSMFYHHKTEAEIIQLKEYLRSRKDDGREDRVDRWIRMVATSRLTGHSPGFFSVYTLPPNQAASRKSQIEINRRLGNSPDYRNVKDLILRKSVSLLRDVGPGLRKKINHTGETTEFITCNALRAAEKVQERKIDLTITSPPFLNLVQYGKDNWMRCWFNSLDLGEIEKSMFISGSLEEWKSFIFSILKQLFIVTVSRGHVAFEVGEVTFAGKRINLDEVVASLGIEAGFSVNYILVNKQKFTKTSNIWGVENQKKGTNTNRIVVMERP